MNNPGHNKTFNNAAEQLAREEDRDFMSSGLSREWIEAAEEARVLDEAAAERAATTVNESTDGTSAQIAEVVAEIDPLVELEARRAALTEEIAGLKYDLTVPENSVDRNFKYSGELDAAEEALEQVEEQINLLSQK
jgi:hypothetical protein